MIKKLWSWFVEAIKETLNLSWTLVGLVIATLTLTGSARQITGLATIITLGIWLLTISFRKGDNMDCCGSGCCGGKIMCVYILTYAITVMENMEV